MRALRQPVTVPEATRSAATSDGKSTCKPCCLEDGLIATDPHVAAGAVLDGAAAPAPGLGPLHGEQRLPGGMQREMGSITNSSQRKHLTSCNSSLPRLLYRSNPIGNTSLPK